MAMAAQVRFMSRRPYAQGPPTRVVDAFGGDPHALVRLEGGEGTSWRAGNIALKPAADSSSAAWIAEFGKALDTSGRFRVASPVSTEDDRWVVDGWAATRFVEGSPAKGATRRIVEVSAAFHAAAASAEVLWPPAMAAREDPWSVGMKIAWRELEPEVEWPAPARQVLETLRPLLDRVVPARQSQVIHSDLGGDNVLFADEAGLPPAVIDISPQYRPAAYADAIIVADAVAWDGAPLHLAEEYLSRRTDADELLARAVVFRISAAVGLWPAPARVAAEVDGYRPLLPLLVP